MLAEGAGDGVVSAPMPLAACLLADTALVYAGHNLTHGTSSIRVLAHTPLARAGLWIPTVHVQCPAAASEVLALVVAGVEALAKHRSRTSQKRRWGDYDVR